MQYWIYPSRAHVTVAEPGVMSHFFLLHGWGKNRVIKLGSKPKSNEKNARMKFTSKVVRGSRGYDDLRMARLAGCWLLNCSAWRTDKNNCDVRCCYGKITDSVPRKGSFVGHLRICFRQSLIYICTPFFRVSLPPLRVSWSGARLASDMDESQHAQRSSGVYDAVYGSSHSLASKASLRGDL